MFCYQYSDPKFLEGLRQHGMAEKIGLRLLNTGADPRSFRDKWQNNDLLTQAKDSSLPYYFDRISGGIQYQSLDGLSELAAELKTDPLFGGFQAHEWGHSPFMDLGRIRSLILDKGLPFDYEHFKPYEGRIEYPFFSGGDYARYRNLYRPIEKLSDAEGFMRDYFRQTVELCHGQVMAVNGHSQLYVTALQLGAKNVMAEVGNQVLLTAFAIACIRGAAREYSKPFGIYYETWGGEPFSCCCEMDHSPWFPNKKGKPGNFMGDAIGPGLGSSRSLQRRLLYYSWLSGAAWCSEEWGPENYFSNWNDYTLTDYGRVFKEFFDFRTRNTQPTPIVPAAIIMPKGYIGVDINYLGNNSDYIYGTVKADDFHGLMRRFSYDLLARRERTQPGTDDYNLTPSPWSGCFDMLSADADSDLLEQYDLLIYCDQQQADQADIAPAKKMVYQGQKKQAEQIKSVLREKLPFEVRGEVGCTYAQKDGRYLIGVFNNLGITKKADGEFTDPNATRDVQILSGGRSFEPLLGSEYIKSQNDAGLDLRIPGGKIAILSFAGAALGLI